MSHRVIHFLPSEVEPELLSKNSEVENVCVQDSAQENHDGIVNKKSNNKDDGYEKNLNIMNLNPKTEQ